MSDPRSLLERETRRFIQQEGAFERLAERRDRKRRNKRIRAGVLGLAIAIAVGLLGVNAIRSASSTPADHPTPTPGSLGSLAYAVDGDIYVADWDGSNPVRIADGHPPNGGPGCGPAQYWGEGSFWSPDGRYLAYWYQSCEVGSGLPPGANSADPWGNVIISDREGNLVASFPGQGWLISWSPDSTRVAVWISQGETIGVYGLDGERQTVLTLPPGLMSPGDHDPVWSPDGESLLVPNGVEIPLDGSAPLKLPSDDPRSRDAAYSPDGSRVAYTTHRSLIVAAADGSHPREVVVSRRLEDPVWSPSRDRIAFVYSETAAYARELRVIDLATGTVTSLDGMDGSDWISVIEFSPKGDRILFSKTGDFSTGVSSLWSIKTDGSDLRRLVVGTAYGDWLSGNQTG